MIMDKGRDGKIKKKNSTDKTLSMKNQQTKYLHKNAQNHAKFRKNYKN